jgi:hypothetical protein
MAQWFIIRRLTIQQAHSHGDVPFTGQGLV